MWLPFPIRQGSILHTGKTVWRENLKRKYKAELSKRIAGLLKTYPDQTQDGFNQYPKTLTFLFHVQKRVSARAPSYCLKKAGLCIRLFYFYKN